MAQNLNGRSVSELVSTFMDGMGRMVTQEMDLAKAELAQKASLAIWSIVLLAAGGAVAFAGFLALVAAAVAAVWLALPLWLSALLVGIVVIAIGLSVAMIGVNELKKGNFKPEQTIDSLKEGLKWMRSLI